MALTPESKVLQTVGVPHSGNRFLWKILNGARITSGGVLTDGGPEVYGARFGPGHRTIIPLRHPVSVAISFLNRGEDIRVPEFDALMQCANERTLFFRVDCAETERPAELARLQAHVSAGMHEQMALDPSCKPPRHELRTDWTIEGWWSKDALGWKARRDEVADMIRGTFDPEPFRALGYEV